MIAFLLFLGFVFFVGIVKATADVVVSQSQNTQPPPPTINVYNNRIDKYLEKTYYNNRIIINQNGKKKAYIYDPKNDYFIEE
ncbi:MAG TPA: hypothetical protein PLG34_08200 [Spirochaetota bacterium]|jgi:multisubunit Na+/H+ antiporter MnhE subunit|nr:hypothetical protein [Spirochaetota bacterium]HQB60124.1 hypothetical protein [Spirochaetota bacterium]